MLTSQWRRAVRWTAGCAGVLAVTSPAFTPVNAGCNCRGGGTSAVVVPPAPEPLSYGDAAGLGVAPTFAGAFGGGPPPMPAPPPGTLGQTYLHPTRPVPADKHPRAGMLDVRAPGASSVSVQWTNPFRLEEELDGFVDARDAALWHFEAPQLIPGNPQIYRVEARYGSGENCTVQERYVRLVMGRIVEVSF